MTQIDDETANNEMANENEHKGDGGSEDKTRQATAPNEQGEGDGEGADPGAGVDGFDIVGELADTKDRLLRALAEVENVRRRAQRDRHEASRYAIASFAREMVTVADNLRRALEAVTTEERKASAVVESLTVGVEMTESAMLAAFERVGITRIEAVGKPFDHNFHEALFEVSASDHPAGIITQEVERGYVLHDRLLRPAKVGVAKGAPKAEAVHTEEISSAEGGSPCNSKTHERSADLKSQAGPSSDKIDG
jgi:molecular chaperone GrpE